MVQWLMSYTCFTTHPSQSMYNVYLLPFEHNTFLVPFVATIHCLCSGWDGHRSNLRHLLFDTYQIKDISNLERFQSKIARLVWIFLFYFCIYPHVFLTLNGYSDIGFHYVFWDPTCSCHLNNGHGCLSLLKTNTYQMTWIWNMFHSFNFYLYKLLIWYSMRLVT